MDHAPNNNYLQTKQFVSEFYKSVEWLFDMRKIPAGSDLFDNRYSELVLTEKELEFIGPNLEKYAIDAPEHVDITLVGRNPELYKSVSAGGVTITMNYHDNFGYRITSSYGIWLDQTEKEPVIVQKDVIKRNEVEETREHGILSAMNLSTDYIYKQHPLDLDEREGLTKMVESLWQNKNF